ncbi:MAG TPA: hypothetical protein VL262_13115 [Vicinamibacterales bacterium]|jgi:hypothetical protein|nr:hypothetical protein [Vicinamibacterales bacterium]
MRTPHTPFVRRAAVLAVGAALATVGCATRDAASTDARLASPSPAMSVACEPTQRAVVHPTVIDGVAMSQVACVSTAATTTTGTGVQTVSYVPQPAVAPAPAIAYERAVSYDAPRVVPATYTTAAPQRVVDEPVRHYTRRPTRSVKKSAVIIGSSAGAGAGLGAVIGGKKGAAIGALLGGGGATLWDQITRHKQNQ